MLLCFFHSSHKCAQHAYQNWEAVFSTIFQNAAIYKTFILVLLSNLGKTFEDLPAWR